MEKCLISDTGTHNLKNDVKHFMSLFPTEKVFEIAMDYLANDEEVREFVAYIQSEEFPKIHKTVEHLKKYKDVSIFMCISLKTQSDNENICSFSTGVRISLF